MKIIQASAHPSNLDPAAALVASDRGNCDWAIYSVTGGFVLTLRDGRAVDGLFPTQTAAEAAIPAALTH